MQVFFLFFFLTKLQDMSDVKLKLSNTIYVLGQCIVKGKLKFITNEIKHEH